MPIEKAREIRYNYNTFEKTGDIMKKLMTIIISVLLVAVCLAGCGSAPMSTSKYDDVKKQFSKPFNTFVSEMLSKKNEEKQHLIPDDATYLELAPVKQETTSGEKKMYGGYTTLGAEEGWRVSFTAGEDDDKRDVNLEIYYFGDEKPNKTAKAVIDSVKKNGYFHLEELDENIDSTLSADSKFLVIYQGDTKQNTKDVEKFVKSYKA